MQILDYLKKRLELKSLTFLCLVLMSFELKADSITIGKTPQDTAQIARELAGIQNPSQDLANILSTISTLDSSERDRSLREMTGQQYAFSFILSESSGRQFLRRLYDPLRPLVTTAACSNSRQFCNDSSLDMDWLDSGCSQNTLFLSPWLEAGGGGVYVNNRGCRLKGLNQNQWQVSGGLQGSIETFTLGIAGTYEKDSVSYSLNGSGKGKSGYGAIYGLYRPCGWYVLGNIAYGFTNNALRRRIEIDTQSFQVFGKYRIHQFLSYIEAGFDINWKKSLFQPFLGFECNSNKRDNINEKGKSPLNLSILGKSCNTTISRLGFHMTTEVFGFSDCPCSQKSFLSFDFAWTYRLTDDPKFGLKESFQSFGDTFTIRGIRNDRSGIDGALTFTTDIFDRFQFYAEALGIFWGKNISYSFLGGVNYVW